MSVCTSSGSTISDSGCKFLCNNNYYKCARDANSEDRQCICPPTPAPSPNTPTPVSKPSPTPAPSDNYIPLILESTIEIYEPPPPIEQEVIIIEEIPPVDYIPNNDCSNSGYCKDLLD